MSVELILTRKGREVRTIRPDASVEDALRRLRAERIGALVVSGDGAHLVGLVSERDILNAIADRGVGVLGEAVGRVMTEKVFTCTRDDDVSSVMALMTDRRVRHVPVIGKDGRLGGIVSIGDMVKHRLDELQAETEAMREYIVRTR